MSRYQSASLAGPVGDAVAAALGKEHRRDPIVAPSGGPAGNAKLTAWLGLGLLLLFLVEGVTLLSLHSMLGVHIFVGAVLVPLLIAKTLTTGWRIVRYYLRRSEYVEAGPPPLLLRLLGPLVVLTGLAVLGTGLALIATGPATAFDPIFSVAGHGLSPLNLHKVAFVLWLVFTTIHALTRLIPAAQLVVGATPARARVPGRVLRTAVLLAIVVPASVAVGVVILDLSGSWRGPAPIHFHDRFRKPSAAAAPAPLRRGQERFG